jgi:L-2,4-diaminobutyric acid acetyltransferase
MSGKTFDRATVDIPSISDGAGIWRVARDAGVLDLNSPYSYLLCCRDFAGSSAVARVGDEVIGFAAGYMRPTEPETLLVWQIVVADAHRCRRVATSLLDGLLRRTGARHLEATVNADNEPSIGLLRGLAARWSAGMTGSQLFAPSQFPDEHPAEFLFRIGPFVSVFAPQPG